MLVLASVAFGARWAAAADPPQPDFFWPYGRVTLEGGPVAAGEVLVALIDGKACGDATTKVAEPGPGVPAEDEGATVYVVDVLADGDGPGRRPGCGREGDLVMLYFAGSRRIAVQEPAFAAGPRRVDVELGPELAYQSHGAMVASD